MLLEFLSSAGGGGLAGAGLSLLGGMFGQKKADKSRALDRQMAQAQFDAQMDETIQRRIKDAQAAGIHPLFALGANAGASPTLSAGGDSSQAGAPMANALGKAGQLLANASIAKTHAEAQLAAAQAARVRQDMDSQGRDAVAKIPDNPLGISLRTPEQGGDSQGRIPSRVRSVDPMGNEFTLPNPDLGLDEVGQVEYVLGLPDRMVKTFRKNAHLKHDIRHLDRELAYLRDQRLHGGKDARSRAYAISGSKLRELRRKYTRIRNKLHRAWREWQKGGEQVRQFNKAVSGRPIR